MSRLDEIKEQLKATGTRLSDKIQESESYAKLQDRYQTLSPSGQKFVWLGGAALAALIILFFPFSQLSTSQEMISSFEEKRSLIRDLFKTYRESSGSAAISPPPPMPTLRNQIESVLTVANLIPEQRVGILEIQPEGKLIPASLVSGALEIKLAKLNIKQIVDIGASLVAISESVKMNDLIMMAHAKDTRYYDVTFKLYALKVPEPPAEAPPEPEVRPKKGTSKPTESGEDSDQ